MLYVQRCKIQRFYLFFTPLISDSTFKINDTVYASDLIRDHKYETGRQIPPIDRICDIADIFEVSTDYLLGCIEFAPPLSKLEEIFYENMTYEQLILQLSDLSEDSKRIFISILERMIDTNAAETD